MNLTAAVSVPDGADESSPVSTGLYALYAERDGIAIGWEFCDMLDAPQAARALLPDVRRELATLNEAGHFHGTSYIHLLRHMATGCECLTTEAPEEGCRVLETFAPREAASGQDDQDAAQAWSTTTAAKVASATPAASGVRWDDYPIHISEDPAKRDLELIHTACGQRLCDVEHGNTLPQLVGMVEDHAAECGRLRVPPPGKPS
ncbi:hypothetical protein [Streptomyces sp. S1D4-20]|uniref:hypothetical protein n=1 Tax=Streptomyces sp. S1D4-20 TaxID=2594462 RepID=UPI0011620270|nr:hypothetical protein [Streptomyces sp. S1D4-20]QDN54276.1 hypothetical protein FNV67_01560 [Streptomyces sp. S1D4-20]